MLRVSLVLLVGVVLCGWVACSSRSALYYPQQDINLRFFPKTNHVVVDAEKAELGRYLFYDPILSLDSTLSCAGCHKQAHAFTDSPNKLSKGFNGQQTARNTMPLFNLAWYSAYFWDGRAATLEAQVFHPVSAHNEMNLRWPEAEKRINGSRFYTRLFRKAYGNVVIDSVLIADAIAQFERTLISNQSKYDSVLRGEAYFTEDEFQGFVLVNDQSKGDCLHCHTTDADALGTTGAFSNNGLDNFREVNQYQDIGRGLVTGSAGDYGHFRIPSLRNVALTAPYMHDGRFGTLDEVLDFYNEGIQSSINLDSKMTAAHRGGVHLSAKELMQVKAFLLTLTDSVFITNPAFANPF